MNQIIVGKDCEDCKYATIEGDRVYCSYRDKKYFYGQYVPCEDYEKTL